MNTKNALGLALATLFSCGLAQAAGPQVNIYNWYDFDVVMATGDLLPNLIKAGVLKELEPAQLPNRSHLARAIVMATLFPPEPLPLKLERVRTRVWSKVKSGT